MLYALVAALALGQVRTADLPADPCESLIVAQARQALSTFRAARMTHGDGRTLSVTYEGTARIEAHLMRPGMTRDIPVSIEVVDDESSRALKLREVSGPERRIETTIILDGRASQQSGDGPFQEIGPDSTHAADAECWMPWSIARSACAAGPSCRIGPPLENATPVTFVDSAHRACTALIDGNHRIARVECLASDQRLGDVCCWTSFSDWEIREGAAVPRTAERFIVQGSVTVHYTLSLKSFTTASVPREAFQLSGSHHDDLPTWGEAHDPGIEFVPIEHGIWAAEIGAANARVLVIERDHDLVLLGAPDGDQVCGALVAALGTKFEGKPIGTSAISHHHPSPSGGLRAIAATGASITVPRRLEPYGRWLLSRRTELGGPAVPGPREPRLKLFDGQTTIDCGAEQVSLIDIGEQSAHAFHYVVFFLPRSGVLFEDDLGYFPKNGGARAGPRISGLVEAVHALHISPRRLIQAWPVRDAVREVPWEDVEALARAPKQGPG